MLFLFVLTMRNVYKRFLEAEVVLSLSNSLKTLSECYFMVRLSVGINRIDCFVPTRGVVSP